MTGPVGFVGLGNMGFPVAERLLAAGYPVLAFDVRADAVEALVALGADAAPSATAVADAAETVLASLPTPQAARAVATDIAAGARVRRLVDLSTIGTTTAQAIHAELASRGIGYVDSPVSGGAAGARAGTLAVMISGADDDVDAVLPLLESFGRPTRLGTQPGAAQTMKLLNNLLAGSALAVTAEAMVMGVRAGLDAATMIDVFNAGSGANTATRDKFPRAVLPRTFDYGFAAALMAKDLRLCMAEADELGLALPLGAAVAQLWDDTATTLGPDADFTAVIQPIERAAGVTVESAPVTPPPQR